MARVIVSQNAEHLDGGPPVTPRQTERLRQMPPGYKLVGAQKGARVLGRPDGRRLLRGENGRLAGSGLVQRVQSYLHVASG